MSAENKSFWRRNKNSQQESHPEDEWQWFQNIQSGNSFDARWTTGSQEPPKKPTKKGLFKRN